MSRDTPHGSRLHNSGHPLGSRDTAYRVLQTVIGVAVTGFSTRRQAAVAYTDRGGVGARVR